MSSQTADMEITLRPIGIVHSDMDAPSLEASKKGGVTLKGKMEEHRKQYRKRKKMISEIEIFPQYEEALEGIEEFSHILVLFWPHLIPEERRKKVLRVHPMGRKDIEERGVFATCSPARPNSVLVSSVKLIERNGCVLKVQAFDGVDGSPVIDVKPSLVGYPEYDEVTVPRWMEKIHEDLRKEQE